MNLTPTDITRPGLLSQSLIVNTTVTPPALRPELFLLPKETIQSTSTEEVAATFTDMEKLGIAKLPYHTVDISMPAQTTLRVVNGPDDAELKDAFEGWQLQYRYENEAMTKCLLKSPPGQYFDLAKILPNQDSKLREVSVLLRRLLIVLLATRNATKTRTKDKLLSMGIGKSKSAGFRPLYTTTITVPSPSNLPNHPDSTPGTPRRPHLRRGHIRNQRHGPHLQFTKAIWIEPTFVNCDESFISARTAYNTSLTLGPQERPN